MISSAPAADHRPGAPPTSVSVYLSAGEPSGDEYGAEVARRLGAASGVRLHGMGGSGMASAGVELHTQIDHLTAMGLAEVVSTLPAHWRALRTAKTFTRSVPADVAVLIDYQAFHLRAARAFRGAGIPVLQFVAPKLWAWGAHRAARYRSVVDRMAVIFPFEEQFLARLGLAATFVGHPVMDVELPGRAAARQALSLGANRRVLALFPGSRRQENERLWPLFRDVSRQLAHNGGDVDVVIAGCRGLHYPDSLGCQVVYDDAATVMAAADAVVCKSGTSNLLAARLGVPMVVAHRVHPVSYAVAKRVLRTPHISPVNILAQRQVVPELIQGAASPENMLGAVGSVLDNPSVREAQREAYLEVLPGLGPFNACAQVADLALEMAAGRV